MSWGQLNEARLLRRRKFSLWVGANWTRLDFTSASTSATQLSHVCWWWAHVTWFAVQWKQTWTILCYRIMPGNFLTIHNVICYIFKSTYSIFCNILSRFIKTKYKIIIRYLLINLQFMQNIFPLCLCIYYLDELTPVVPIITNYFKWLNTNAFLWKVHST